MARRSRSSCVDIFAAIATLAAASLPVPCLAEVDISTADDAKTVNVVVEQASFDDILNKLGEHFHFGVERAVDAKASTASVSLTLSGTLDSVLKRLLRNRNYMIVRRPDNVEEIEKVVILTATEGALPSAPAPAAAASTPPPPAVPPSAIPPKR